MSLEADFISALRRLPLHEGARGLQDDAAVLSFGSEQLILTHDMMVEGRHWLKGSDPADVAHKLVAVNLSDLAAKGARPIGLMLGFMLGDAAWDKRFLQGLDEALIHYNVPLLGGDTVGGAQAGSEGKAIGLTALGRATTHTVPCRTGAQAGDNLVLIGAIGDAMAGYELECSTHGATGHDVLRNAFNRPAPLIAEGQLLAPLAHAMMDVSDGLLLDAARMAHASGLTVKIRSDDVPMSASLGRFLNELSETESSRLMAARLGWGDDYALLAAVAANTEIPVTANIIGSFEAQSANDQDTVLIWNGAPLPLTEVVGYQH